MKIPSQPLNLEFPSLPPKDGGKQEKNLSERKKHASAILPIFACRQVAHDFRDIIVLSGNLIPAGTPCFTDGNWAV
jgi:hypothetical protein